MKYEAQSFEEFMKNNLAGLDLPFGSYGTLFFNNEQFARERDEFFNEPTNSKKKLEKLEAFFRKASLITGKSYNIFMLKLRLLSKFDEDTLALISKAVKNVTGKKSTLNVVVETTNTETINKLHEKLKSFKKLTPNIIKQTGNQMGIQFSVNNGDVMIGREQPTGSMETEEPSIITGQPGGMSVLPGYRKRKRNRNRNSVNDANSGAKTP